MTAAWSSMRPCSIQTHTETNSKVQIFDISKNVPPGDNSEGCMQFSVFDSCFQGHKALKGHEGEKVQECAKQFEWLAPL